MRDEVEPEDLHESDLSGDDDFDGDEDEDYSEDLGPIPQVFSAPDTAFLREGLSEVYVPSYLARLPPNFGEASHGKLKADQWLVAFGVYFPLILPELWSADGSSRKIGLLNNFEHLVACTNIVSAHTTSDTEADKYMHHYTEYRRSVPHLFSRSNSRPNHHYAMHNPDLMKFWGPLIKLSEYRYESHNGALQRINTNHHLCMSSVLSLSGTVLH